MRIGYLNDTHYGFVKAKHLRRLFQEMKIHKPNIIIHCGDYCGESRGAPSVNVTTLALREVFPETPILSVIGNHDYWCGKRPSLYEYQKNYNKILEIFKDRKIHYLHEDGIFRYKGITFVGVNGWYSESCGENDQFHLPINLEGDTNKYFYHKSYMAMNQYLDELTSEDIKRIFISHFPVLDCNPWDWDGKIGEMLKLEGFTLFFSGHSHEERKGPIHYRTASDYGEPRFGILEI